MRVGAGHVGLVVVWLAVGYLLLGGLRTAGVVGALFTLSPPLSMIAFAATLFPADPELVAVAVAAYAVIITATMSALGAGVGALVAGPGVSLVLGTVPLR